MIRFCFAFALAVVATASQVNAAINVAVLGAPATAAWNTEVQNKLIATGQFMTVDAYLINLVTPTLAQLNAYDAVLVYSDFGIQNTDTFGDTLADFFDGGGGVVTAVFASNTAISIGGRWDSDNYWALLPEDQTDGPLTLGTVNNPLHPVMSGVTSFDGGDSSYRGTGDPHPSATVIAEWSNGDPLVLERTIGGAPRIDLNFYPPSTDSRSDFWDAATDGDLLLANALTYVAGRGDPGVVPEPATWAVWTLLGSIGAAIAIRGRRQ